MLNWKAKVHTAGSKVAIFQNDKLIKVINAAEETFKPAEATKFAQELLEELEYRYACDIDTSDIVEKSIDTEAKKKVEDEDSEGAATDEDMLETLLVEPKGQDLPASTEKCEDTEDMAEPKEDMAEPKMEYDDDDDDEPEELPAEDEEVVKVEEEDEDLAELSEEPSPLPDVVELEAANKKVETLKRLATNFKGLLEKERSERDIERRARRGLAIAKQMVANGDLDDDYNVVRAKVAEIVDLDEKDIEITERKTAGISEFDTDKEAAHEARRQRRLARITTIASEDAQHEGDVEEADRLDVVASLHAEKAEKYEKLAAKMKEDGSKKEDKESAKEDKKEKEAAKPEGDIPTGQPKDVGYEDSGTADLEKKIVEPQGKDLPAGVKGGSKEEKTAKIAELRAKIADVRLSAEASEAIGDPKTADEYDTQADEFEQEADLLEAEFEKEYAEPKDEEEAAAEEKPEEEAAAEEKPEEEAAAEEKPEDEDAAETGEEDEKAMEGVEFFPPENVELPTEPTMTEASKKAKKDKDEKAKEEKEKKEKKKQDKEDKEEKEVEEAKEKKEKKEQDKKDKEEKEKKEKKDASMIEGFGFDKAASVVDQNDYSNDSEMNSLEKIWHGKPDDIE